MTTLKGKNDGTDILPLERAPKDSYRDPFVLSLAPNLAIHTENCLLSIETSSDGYSDLLSLYLALSYQLFI
jgi:hypothetical protein